MELTQEYVKELFDYKDGFLYWKIITCNKNKSGLAGSISKQKSGNRRMVRCGGNTYYASRLIFLWHYGYLPKFVDHKDRDVTNKIDNLRAATESQNGVNVTKKKNKTSVYLGVCLKGNCWVAQISVYKKKKHLGSFKSEIGAAKAYNAAAKLYYGEFANLNSTPHPH